MFIADLHIHSAYSRATSKEGLPPKLEWAARRKGLQLLGTGDFTHPAYRKLLQEQLQPEGNGLYLLKPEFRIADAGLAADEMQPRFLVSGEISTIYQHNGKGRKVHHVILYPSLEAAEELSRRLEALGCNLHADGRPIIGLSSSNLLELTLDVCPQAIFIPAHIWTPYFSVFGAYSSYTSIEECYGSLAKEIHAVETGLSSDPPMNWRLSQLDAYTLISNSDAHSPEKLAREANLFDCAMDYAAIREAISNRDSKGFAGTIEFYPEEGKYHWDGHRQCKCCCSPKETLANHGLCPVCGKPVTVGVSHQVELLADRPEGYHPDNARPFENLVPLAEMFAASLGVTTASRRVQEGCNKLLQALGPELYLLRECPLEDIAKLAGPCVTEGLRRLREGKIRLSPGYDGEYGKVTVLDPEDIDRLTGQTSLFQGFDPCMLPPKRKARVNLEKDSPTTPVVAQTPIASLGLSPEQEQAATTEVRVAAILAGPGCGKTRTLVNRIAYLLEKGVPAAEITAVTFTNKAAREMRERLSKTLDKQTVKSLHIGTFHSLGLERARTAGKKISLLDENQALSLAEEVIQQLHSEITPKALLKQVSRHKAQGEAASRETQRYLEMQQEWAAWDFDDILLWAKEEAEAEGTNLSAFHYLLVDEFQDVNPMQYQLIQAWQKESKSLFVIGDPDQAIYSFRGSDSACFQRLAQDHPDMTTYYLRTDHRSTPEILRIATAILEPAVAGLTAAASSGEPVHLVENHDPRQEAIAMAKEINELLGGVDMLAAQKGSRANGDFGLNDIAILCRTHRQQEIIGECLGIEGIPYRIGGRDNFLSSRSVRETMAFFRLLQTPEDTLLLRTVLQNAGVLGELTPTEQATLKRCRSIKGLCKALDNLGETSHNAQTLSLLLQNFLPLWKKGKPLEILQRWEKESYLQESEGMEEFLQLATMYSHMSELLHDVVFGTEGDLLRSGGKTYTPEGVSLLTIHGSKGLEFPVVFLAGVQKGLLPLEAGESTNLPEERRLFYVGITRGEKLLYLYTGGAPSPFLQEIPTEYFTLRTNRRFYQGKQLSLFD